MTDFIYVLILLWGAAFLVCFAAFAVHLYRSEGTPQSPVGGAAKPRNVPPAGPQQPGVSPTPPTGGARCRRTVPFSDPSDLNGTVSPGWRMS